MAKTAFVSLTLAAFLGVGVSALAQRETKQSDPQNQVVPVDTQWTLDAAGTVQRNAIRSVLLLICTKTNMKGTGFLISDGKIITAAHVVAGCKAADVRGTTPLGQSVQFSHSIVRDENLDLAVLVPTAALDGGLDLGPDANIPLGKKVTTWGLPLIYNAPALSSLLDT